MKKLLFLAASLIALNANVQAASNDGPKEHGALKLGSNGVQLCGAEGEAVQLKGFSTFSIHYTDGIQCLGQAAFKAMADFNANIVRLAVYPRTNEGGYVAKPNDTFEKITQYIDLALQYDMYCLVDWHVLSIDNDSYASGDPSKYKTEAKDMFSRVSAYVKENNYTHVLYELCNEPSGVTMENILAYAKEVIPSISANDPNAVIIVGTPNWDQQVQQAKNQHLAQADYTNPIFYAFHMYACSHMGYLSNFTGCLTSIPVFVSEWGSGDYSGGGSECCTDNANTFMSTCSSNSYGVKVSWCYWAWGNKNEYSNVWVNGACSANNYTNDYLTTSGKYIQSVLMGTASLPELPTSGAYDGIGTNIPTKATGTTAELNIGFFDKVDEKKFNSGEGYAYHDKNSGILPLDEDGNTDYSADVEDYINSGNGDEGHGSCNAGAYYSGNPVNECFRYLQCVDVSNSTAGPGADWSGSTMSTASDGASIGGTSGDGQVHNLCLVEAGEWVNYTINVLRPGYYKVYCLTSSTTTGGIPIQMTCDGKNVIRNVSEKEDPNALTEAYLIPSTTGITPAWENWQWNPIVNEDEEAGDIRVLFAKEGTYVFQLGINLNGTETAGDIGHFYFVLDDEDIPASETGVDETVSYQNAADFSVAPNPATEGFFTITLADASAEATAQVVNALGQVVYNASFVGNTTVSKNLAAGVYTVRVNSNGTVKTSKLVVK